MSNTILQQYFGYADFRPGQQQIVDSIISGRDTLALLPTGGGKSLCYQVPGLALPGTTLVISPLISLMKDQVDALVRRGISATVINSALTEKEKSERMADFLSSKYTFVYISPERLQSIDFIQACQKINISLVAIDEAHCIAQWGHDFRPEYRLIALFLQQLPKRPTVAAFTASATPQVRQEICQSLQLKEPRIFLSSFQRSNLHIHIYECQRNSEKQLLLCRILKKYAGQQGIIYCNTRAETELLAQFLDQLGFAASFYHGGMETKQRAMVQENFQTGKTKIVVATNAFGMGIDVATIRYVVHWQVPTTVEGYYQEIGRAGRDGAESECFLMWTEKDLQLNNERFVLRFPPMKIVKTVWKFVKMNKIGDQSSFYSIYRHVPFISVSEFLNVLKIFEELQLITLNQQQKSFTLVRTEERNLINWLQLHSTKSKQLESMHQFVRAKSCRMKYVLHYFGEINTPQCQKCDQCQTAFSLSLASSEKQLLQQLRDQTHILAKRFRRQKSQVASETILLWLITLQPATSEQILAIPGVGKGWVEKYWPLFNSFFCS